MDPAERLRQLSAPADKESPDEEEEVELTLDPEGDRPADDDEETIANLLIDSAPTVKTPSPAKARKEKASRAPQLAASPASGAVTCPKCGEKAEPAAVLSGGRVRCSACKATFFRWERPRQARKDDEETFFQRWKRPLTVAGSVAAVLVLSALVFRPSLFGNTNRVRVYRTQGTAVCDGQPMPNATVYLHPIGGAAPDVPRPRAVVRDDGTFVVGTYGKDDGAPPGDYKITVEWFAPGEQKNNPRGPQNVLPAKYARPDTSDLIVHVEAGDNQLPPIRLNRAGK